MARYADARAEVVALYLTRGEAGVAGKDHGEAAAVRTAEAEAACRILKARPVFAAQVDGATEVTAARYAEFAELLLREKPDVVFTQWPVDTHADHRACAALTIGAWLRLGRSFALYYYEVSDGEDTTQFPAPTHYVDITDLADTKKAACYAHASQSPDYYYGLQGTVASFRGLQSGCKRAEAYILQIGSADDVFPRAGAAGSLPSIPRRRAVCCIISRFAAGGGDSRPSGRGACS